MSDVLMKVLWCYLFSLHASLSTLCSCPLLFSLSSLSPVFFLAQALDMTVYKCISDGVLWHMARKSTAHTSLIFQSLPYSGSKNCPNVCIFFKDLFIVLQWPNQFLSIFLYLKLYHNSFLIKVKSCDLNQNSCF